MYGDDASEGECIMGEKDVTEKYLMAFNDVFVDIYNVLLFEADVLKEEYLRSGGTESVYKEAEKSRIQQRDVVKEYGEGYETQCVLGIENQSKIDLDMPIRIMGYDYGNYRQMVDNDTERVPVITIVLNFGDKRWKSPHSLTERVKKIPDEMETVFQDYKIYVFDVAFLPKEVRNKFRSDFKIVADFFAEKESEDYVPGAEKIDHVEAVLELIMVFTGDERYREIKEEIMKLVTEGREVTMCTFADRMEKRGFELGEKRGFELGEKSGIAKVAENMLKSKKSVEEIKMFTGLSVDRLKELADELGVVLV